jgi:hypothetical protein
VPPRRHDRQAGRLEAADEFAYVLPHLGPGLPRTRSASQLLARPPVVEPAGTRLSLRLGGPSRPSVTAACPRSSPTRFGCRSLRSGACRLRSQGDRLVGGVRGEDGGAASSAAPAAAATTPLASNESPGRQPAARKTAKKAPISASASVGPSTPKARSATTRSSSRPRAPSRSTGSPSSSSEVQLARRLVREQDRIAGRKRASDRHPLLLTARELLCKLCGRPSGQPFLGTSTGSARRRPLTSAPISTFSSAVRPGKSGRSGKRS